MSRMNTILIVDDEVNLSYTLRLILEKDGYRILLAESGEKALFVLASEPVDLVIADISMAGMSGMELLSRVKDDFPDTEVIMMTAYGSEEIAVKAMKGGAYDYIPKPFKNDEISLVVGKACEKINLSRKALNLQRNLEDRYGFDKIVGVSQAMKRVYEMISRVVDTDVTILLNGESGVGKEVVANAIHFNGQRRNRAFVKINCAAIPDTLLESELFGHEKGAFTGATKTHKGKFEQAHGGTLFLDEIGDMTLQTQAKVLRAIQEREFERVGGKEVLHSDVRIITATNRELSGEIKAGRFRTDLYYRLNVINIVIPPLRERKGDIPLLVNSFLHEICSRSGKRVKGISGEVMGIFTAYSWPGNVRELRNAVEHGIVLARSEIVEVNDLPPHLRGLRLAHVDGGHGLMPFVSGNYRDCKDGVIEAFEKEFIGKALRDAGGNIALAARNSGMYRANFYQKMVKYGITAEEALD